METGDVTKSDDISGRTIAAMDAVMAASTATSPVAASLEAPDCQPATAARPDVELASAEARASAFDDAAGIIRGVHRHGGLTLTTPQECIQASWCFSNQAYHIREKAGLPHPTRDKTATLHASEMSHGPAWQAFKLTGGVVSSNPSASQTADAGEAEALAEADDDDAAEEDALRWRAYKRRRRPDTLAEGLEVVGYTSDGELRVLKTPEFGDKSISIWMRPTSEGEFTLALTPHAPAKRLLAEKDREIGGLMADRDAAVQYGADFVRRAQAAEADAAKLREAVDQAEQVFRHYGDLHAAKPDPVKATRNYDLADEMAQALAQTKGRT